MFLVTKNKSVQYYEMVEHIGLVMKQKAYGVFTVLFVSSRIGKTDRE